MSGPTKSALPAAGGIEGILGIGAKTITSIDSYHHGSVEVIDILCTDTKHYYVKLSQGKVDLGGTSEWGTGTMLGGR